MVGKRIRGALYVHRSAVPLLDALDQQRVEQASELAAPWEWNVARLEPALIGLLTYEAFYEDPFPALRAAIRVDLTSATVQRRSFEASANPLILHRKELLVDTSEPAIADWRQLTADLEARDLFRENHLIGRRLQWAGRLFAAGVRLQGHRLCPI